MQQETQYFFQLAAAFVHGERAPAPAPDEMDFDLLNTLSTRTGMEGICGYMLQPHMHLLPPEQAATFTRLFYKTVVIYSRWRPPLETLLQQLSELGIPYALLKGGAIASLYPVPELRTFGDVDIYVPLTHASMLKTFLHICGDTILEEDVTQLCIRRDGLLVEFHFHLEYDTPYKYTALQNYLLQAVDHIVFDEQLGCYTLDRLFHTVYMLAHQMKHQANNCPGARSYMDWAVLLKNGYLPDAALLEKTVEPLGMSAYMHAVFTLVERSFGVPSPFAHMDIADEDLAFLQQQLLVVGLFGKKDNKQADAVSKVGRIGAIWRALFPPAENIRREKQYAELAQRCLPAAYVYRCWYALRHRNSRMRATIKEIMRARSSADNRQRVRELMYISGGQDT